MAKELTIEAVKLYFANNGSECPFCGGTDLQGSSFDVEGGATRQEIFCPDCEEEWTDSYHLATVIHSSGIFDPAEEIDALKAEIEQLKRNEVAILEGLWKELRTQDHSTAPEVMGHLSIIIGEKRGDPDKSLCGCGGEVGFYDGALGYEAMVCKKCGQHYTVI